MISRFLKAISIPAAKPQSLALALVCGLGMCDSSWLKYPSAHVRTPTTEHVITLDSQRADYTITVISEKQLASSSRRRTIVLTGNAQLLDLRSCDERNVWQGISKVASYPSYR